MYLSSASKIQCLTGIIIIIHSQKDKKYHIIFNSTKPFERKLRFERFIFCSLQESINGPISGT